jgi:hypothetical protein
MKFLVTLLITFIMTSFSIEDKEVYLCGPKGAKNTIILNPVEACLIASTRLPNRNFRKQKHLDLAFAAGKIN